MNGISENENDVSFVGFLQRQLQSLKIFSGFLRLVFSKGLEVGIFNNVIKNTALKGGETILSNKHRREHSLLFIIRYTGELILINWV